MTNPLISQNPVLKNESPFYTNQKMINIIFEAMDNQLSLIDDIKRLKQIKKQTLQSQQHKKAILKQSIQNNLGSKNQCEFIKTNIQFERTTNMLIADDRTQQPKPQNQPPPPLDKKPQEKPLNHRQTDQKPQPSKTQINPKLFKGLKFCFPHYNVQLTRKRAESIRQTIQNLSGIVYQIQDIQQYINDSNQNFSIQFMLVDPTIPRQQIQKRIPIKIKYIGIIDYHYVFQCKINKKILNYKYFLIPEKNKQLEIYIKAKQAEKIEQLQNNCPNNKIRNKCTLGMEPIDEKNNTIANTINISKLEKLLNGNIVKSQNQTKIQPNKPTKQGSFNTQIYQSFQKLGQLFEKIDNGRFFAYTRIATVLKTVKIHIYCQQDADKLQGMRFIGSKTIEKIKEIIRKGSIQRLTVLEGKQENLVCQKLEKVWGIGKVRAQQLYNRGIKSVEELRSAVQTGEITLTKNQNVGLKYYEDLNQRIPRDKVTRMFEYIKKTLFRIVGSEIHHQLEVCGSYRRGIATCGDIDVIITRKDGTSQTKLINNLVEELTKQGFLTNHLAMPRQFDPKSCTSYMGICKYQDQKHHRVDIKYYPVEQYAYAILYFTGSNMFNRNMRLFAMKKGYCLSDHGMWKAQKIAGNIVTEGPNIECFTEKQIFESLGIQYMDPVKRSF